jgi:hypothetical protein
VSELIARTDHESLERVSLIERKFSERSFR